MIFRLTETEYARLCVKANEAGLPVNELARRISCGGKLTFTTHRRHDSAFLKRVDRIGQNLNQLVKRAHMLGAMPPAIIDLCRRIDALIDEALEEGAS
ncbi:hypothetical protein [Luteolibacter sp. Populi]|uniref:plasmid mobilization protein n=1 Tax=Luteolibacter sp. Populi TaxID=3230487 RepID=UPI003466C12A